jgi:hypothetical protein
MEVVSKAVVFVLGMGRESSDFWADALELWWCQVKARCGQVKRLMIRLDNGMVCASNRRQWIKRLVEFVDKTGLEVELVYYPPYHSKYNPVERVWGALEQHWSGTLLKSVEVVEEWAKTMSYAGKHPEVHRIETEYQKGVTLDKLEWKQLQQRLERSPTLPKWHVVIKPISPPVPKTGAL